MSAPERIYYDAARVLGRLEAKKGSVKSLVFFGRKAKNEKKAVFALVSRTLERKDLLDKVIESTKLLDAEPKLTYHQALVLTHDLLCGKGLRVRGFLTKLVFRHKRELRESYKRLLSSREKCNEGDVTKVMRYARVNTCKTTHEEVGTKLSLLGFNRQKDIAEFQACDKVFTEDSLVPNLLVFPPATVLSHLSICKSMHLILQGKASCLPAFVLAPKPGSVVIDSCAAPGNKTSQLADIMNDKGVIHAFDKDAVRFKKMMSYLKRAGVTCVRFHRQDFLKVQPEEYADVTCILVDPSCSGSGLVGRHNFNSQPSDKESVRLKSLSRFQAMILKHAMKFPSVQKVAYSTCSIHKEENECVVAEVLDFFSSRFQLVHVLPEWKSRGLPIFPESERCLRVNPEVDLAEGFFLAVFERKE